MNIYLIVLGLTILLFGAGKIMDLKSKYMIVILTAFFMGVLIGTALIEMPEDKGMVVHYVKVMTVERIEETTGIGDTPKTEIIAAEERMVKAAGIEPETTSSTVETMTIEGTTTTVKVPIPYTTVVRPTVTTKSRTDIVMSLTAGSIWENYFSGRKHLIDEINSDAELTDKLRNAMVDEVILLAVMDDKLEWEKKFGIENGRVVLNPEGEPTIWIQIDPETAEELLEYIDSEVRESKITDKVVDYWKLDRIKIYPVGRAKKMYDKLNK